MNIQHQEEKRLLVEELRKRANEEYVAKKEQEFAELASSSPLSDDDIFATSPNQRDVVDGVRAVSIDVTSSSSKPTTTSPGTRERNVGVIAHLANSSKKSIAKEGDNTSVAETEADPGEDIFEIIYSDTDTDSDAGSDSDKVPNSDKIDEDIVSKVIKSLPPRFGRRVSTVQMTMGTSFPVSVPSLITLSEQCNIVSSSPSISVPTTSRSVSTVVTAKQKIEMAQVEEERLQSSFQNEKEVKARALVKRLEERRKINFEASKKSNDVDVDFDDHGDDHDDIDDNDIINANVGDDLRKEGDDEPKAMKKSKKKKVKKLKKSKKVKEEIRSAEDVSAPIDVSITGSIAKLHVNDDDSRSMKKEEPPKKTKKKMIKKKKIKVKNPDAK